MGHDDYKEMIPVHALSALDATDERVLNEHLAECAECRRDLAEWEATAASLALSAKPMEPSPRVRERILTQIHSEEPQVHSEEPSVKDPSVSAEEPSLANRSLSAEQPSLADRSLSENSSPKVHPFAGRSRNLWSSLGSLGSIAAIILFAALVVTVVMLWRENRSLEKEREFYQLLSQPGSRVTELAGTTEATGATAKLAYDKSGRAVLIANGLPPAPQGKEYQLWFIVGNKPLPGKTFAPDTNGNSTVADQVPEVARNSAVFAVTLEPAGGVQLPTGAIYLRGEL